MATILRALTVDEIVAKRMNKIEEPHLVIDEISFETLKPNGYAKCSLNINTPIIELDRFIRTFNAYVMCRDPRDEFFVENESLIQKLNEIHDIKIKAEYRNQQVYALLDVLHTSCLVWAQFMNAIEIIVQYPKEDQKIRECYMTPRDIFSSFGHIEVFI